MNDKNKQIGKKIKIARILAEITQEKFAEKIGVESVTVSRMESGSRNTTAVEIEKISKALNRPLSYFYEEEKEEEISTLSISSEAIMDLRDLDPEDKKFIDELIERFRKEKK